MKKVSIIITCHNFEKYIFRAINSCLNQNFPEQDYEIIIVDDASQDRSLDIINSYRNFSFVKTIFLKKNMGVAFVSNIGIKKAEGEYIVRVDGDDYIHKDFLRVMTEIMDWNRDIGFVYCDLILVEGIGKAGERTFQRNTFERLLEHGAGVMFRKKYLEQLGYYNSELRNCEDHDLILRYSQKYKGYHLHLPYYRYFKRNSHSLSLKKAEREEIKKENFKRLEIKNGRAWERLQQNKPYVIAEAGVNHLGSLELGERLIKGAKEAGADAIKFQSYKAGKLCVRDAPRFWDWEGEEKKDGNQFDSYSLLDSFGKEEHRALKELCQKYEIDYLSTPFDTEAVDYLEEIGVEMFKIAACDLTNLYFLEYVAKKAKPMLLSCGACSLDEIKEAVATIESTGNRQIVVMHCSLCYPTKDEEINLLTIRNLKKNFRQYPIGLSDHTMNLMTPAVAYTLGARIFEKHYTVDKTLDKSADHWLSADVADLKEIISHINTVKTLMGRYGKRVPMPNEERTRLYDRRSVVADKDIKAGEVLSLENIACKRPGTGVSAKYFKDFLGKKAKINIPFDTLILREMVDFEEV